MGSTLLRNRSFPGSKEYWEERYSRGGTSGKGSYGKFAVFKAQVINSFIKIHKINSIIEFGCGDGNQLSLFDLPNYIGLDVSKTAIKLCMERFQNDKRKSFFLYDPDFFEDNHFIFKAELTLSLDVIYHIIEYSIFELYMKHLFSASDKFVIIYSSNKITRQKFHERHRQFTKWVKTNLPKWKLIIEIKNRYPNEARTDFFIYKKESLKDIGNLLSRLHAFFGRVTHFLQLSNIHKNTKKNYGG